MNKAEVWSLFEKIVYYYPNFSAESEKAAAWHDVLAKVPFEKAVDNLKRYVLVAENKYPPHPGALAENNVQRSESNDVPDAKETREMLAEHDRILRETKDTPIPDSFRRAVRDLAARNARDAYSGGARHHAAE